MLVFRKLWTMSVKPQGSLSVCPTLSNAELVGQRQPQRLGCCQKYTEEEVATHNSIKYKKTSGATNKKSRFHYHLCEDFKKKNQSPWVKFLKPKMLGFSWQARKDSRRRSWSHQQTVSPVSNRQPLRFPPSLFSKL